MSDLGLVNQCWARLKKKGMRNRTMSVIYRSSLSSPASSVQPEQLCSGSGFRCDNGAWLSASWVLSNFGSLSLPLAWPSSLSKKTAFTLSKHSELNKMLHIKLANVLFYNSTCLQAKLLYPLIYSGSCSHLTSINPASLHWFCSKRNEQKHTINLTGSILAWVVCI